MRITSKLLKRKRACREQVALFEKLFPNGVEVTEAICVAHADKFNFHWAAENLLSAPALAEYERIEAPAWAEYMRSLAAAWDEYGRSLAAAWDEYGRSRAAAWAEYGRSRAAALAEYERAVAVEFARAANLPKK
jgi:hypothetical protein